MPYSCVKSIKKIKNSLKNFQLKSKNFYAEKLKFQLFPEIGELLRSKTLKYPREIQFST